MDLASMLAGARFYGAKSEAIDKVEVVRELSVEDARLMILRVNGRELYQVLVDATGNDILSTSPHLYLEAVFGTHHGEGLPTGEVRAIEGEQSNTSLIVGDRMVKVFRHLEAGLNPDVELLSEIPDCPNIAPVRGWVTTEIDGAAHTLAMAQDFVPDADDGWRFALGFATLDAPFGAEASLLGEATRAVHEALAAALPVERVGVGTLGERLSQQLDDLVSRAPVLAEFADDARAVYAALADEESAIQRIHGDLHLGQVLRTADSYVIIDFEGEPARPLSERRRPDSPLRDVAGILRSLDYAAHFSSDGPHDPAAWAQEAQDAFLEGYGISPGPLLDAYILDKALYEVVYESDNRPEWVDIPLAAVRRILRRVGS
ncbi:phosphotransferase [Corynebacterium sp. YIM 101645]|uniref:Phosphotransferase n=1 Tax=Corynebacterium lemuris TaxID=1859292 RepID=A0ABT2G0D9_9CORY|nr:phosphotransferase [Corynebacterium lemuris]MCS5480153.1 phosphotransferase [Corynebacterium lemuris]